MIRLRVNACLSHTKADFALATAQRDSCIRILLQFNLKVVDIVGKRVIAFCQALSLTKEFFSIIKGYHWWLCFCSKFLNQCIKRFQVLTRKSSFFSFTEAFRDSLSYKGFFSLSIFRRRYQLVDGHTFDRPKNFFQTWDKAGVLNIQYYLCHN